ncbi:MAG: YncE family protein [Candidatus Andeanibacterium colombiense]|uniref:YncE family protein n=1 Tax=Candidatus Andeanibacterium colombiense TaxID=3121345 RepID=A0AAJ5X5V4_9SPHN|nr:MAG: YncE family protein [Sphingomonadaceae bacterium]
MKKALGLMLSSVALFAAAPSQAQELTEQVQTVPGFADFLAVDGSTVWATNAGRVEQWSTTGKLASVEVPHPCGAMAVAFGSLWVGNCKGGEVYRIDPKTAQVVATIPAGIGPSGEMNVVAGAGSIWAPNQTAGKVSRIDPATNTVVATVDVAAGTSYMAFGFDALWTVSLKGQSLQRVDPKTDSVTNTVALGLAPGFLAAGEGAVWVQEQGDGTVAKIDPATVTVVARTKVGDNLKYGDIDTGAGKVWLRTTDDQTFVVLDAKSAEVLSRNGKAAGSGALRFTPDGVWTTAHDVHTLTWWSTAPKTGE